MHDKNWKANEKWYRKKKCKQYILSSHKLFLTCAVVSRSRNSMAINNKMLAKKEYKKRKPTANEMKWKKRTKKCFVFFSISLSVFLAVYLSIYHKCVRVRVYRVYSYFVFPLRQKITYNDRRAHLSIDGLWL